MLERARITCRGKELHRHEKEAAGLGIAIPHPGQAKSHPGPSLGLPRAIEVPPWSFAWTTLGNRSPTLVLRLDYPGQSKSHPGPSLGLPWVIEVLPLSI